MVSPSTSEQIFEKIREDTANLNCADCGAEPVTFASISHGSLICESCSIAHKNLGPQVSFVKSLNDSWSIRQLKIMTAGGNATLKNFFDSYNMPSSATIDFKYCTVAAKYYREMLKVMAEGESCKMPTPSIEEGLQILADPKSILKPEVKVPQVEEKKNTGYFGGLIGSAYNATVGVGQSLYGKVKEIDTIKKIEEKAYDTVHKVGENIKWGAQKSIEIGKETVGWGAQKGYENLEWGANTGLKIGTQGVNYLKSGAHSAYDSMTTTAVGTYNKINLGERSKKLKEESMNILVNLEKTAVGMVFGNKNKEDEEEKKEEISKSIPERVPTPPEYK
ncbi:hypothetical protein SteCoe_8784 [Stentor coeruleus]|uniref:Arf-GAP domain-containing protein n=1 Tax=Stentor coeruleus TaxID=5963 RepID=A0A1R2CJD6_9CILI|nr:hypothetical protein SteCoe_8784 [Stentor coeruleus]